MTGSGKVVLIGEFGCGNYGNDASLLSVMESLRADGSDIDIVVLARDAAKIRSADAFRELSFRAVDLAYRPILGRLGQLIGRLTDPLRYGRHILGARAVIVPGMGVIEGELGEHPFGVPYLLLVSSVLCRVTGTPLAFVAVGASPLRNRVSLRMARATAGLVCYRSFRDEYSRRVAVDAQVGCPGDRVTVDVALNLPDRSVPPAAVAGVGIGVMNFYGRHPEHAVQTPAQAYDAYLAKMAALCRGVAGLGRSITLFAGDESDVPVAHTLADRLAAEAGPRVTVSAESDYAGLVTAMGGLELVIAPRYHNLIAAVAAGRPLIALTYAEKSAALAERVGLTGVSPDLDDWDPDAVVAQVAGVLERVGSLAELVRAARDRLQQQSRRELSEVAGMVKSSKRRQDWARLGRARMAP